MLSIRSIMIVPILAVVLVVVLIASSYTVTILASQERITATVPRNALPAHMIVQFNQTVESALTTLSLLDLLPYLLAIAALVAGLYLILKMVMVR